jgi:hypothetical protein
MRCSAHDLVSQSVNTHRQLLENANEEGQRTLASLPGTVDTSDKQTGTACSGDSALVHVLAPGAGQ